MLASRDRQKPNRPVVAQSRVTATSVVERFDVPEQVGAKNTDAQWSTSGPTGATGGKSGAVREFLRWVCKPSATHALDNTVQTQTTGRSYNLQITGAVQKAGFNPTVLTNASTTSFGRCKGKFNP